MATHWNKIMYSNVLNVFYYIYKVGMPPNMKMLFGKAWIMWWKQIFLLPEFVRYYSGKKEPANISTKVQTNIEDLFEVAILALFPVHHVMEDGDHHIAQVRLGHQCGLQEEPNHGRDEVQLVLFWRRGFISCQIVKGAKVSVSLLKYHLK